MKKSLPMQVAGSAILRICSALAFSGGAYATPPVVTSLDSPNGRSEDSSYPSGRTFADCESVLSSELQACLSDRLDLAETYLEEVDRAWRERLDSTPKKTRENARRTWVLSRNAECEKVFRETSPGREAAIEHLLCLEQRTLERSCQLSVRVGRDSMQCYRPDATLRFACDSERGDHIVICKAPILGRADREVRIEVASVDLEMAHVSLGSAESSLRYNHYARFQTDYLEIAARLHDSEYRVFRHTEDSQVSYGLHIRSDGEEPGFGIDCAGEVFDELSFLPGNLKCDTKNALGCGVFYWPPREVAQ